MTEFIQELEELKRLPLELHLLCPRQNEEDDTQYDEDGPRPNGEDKKPNVEYLRRIQEAKDRREKFLGCMQLFAYDGDDVLPYKEYMWKRLEDTLGKCERCIGAYYTGKLGLKKKLANDYDEDEVEQFFKVFDDRDIKRISKGLKQATETLRVTPEQKRGLSALDPVALFAIFEALSCEAFLVDNKLLEDHFDEPFRLVQTKRYLKITDYVPASTRFLFDPNKGRSAWAINAWKKIKRAPTTAEFDWTVRDFLLHKLRNAQSTPYDPNEISKLWCALEVIVHGLDKEQITHQLRSLDVDFCKVMLEHLSVDTPGLRFLLHTFRDVLERSPVDFWDAMGSISPSTVIEQVFASPRFDRFLSDASSRDAFEASYLHDMLAWIEPFMLSLKSANQPSACRTLTTQLFQRTNNMRFPDLSKKHCLFTGLEVLSLTIRSFSDNQSSRQSVTRVVLSETLGIVSVHINDLFEKPDFLFDLPDEERLRTLRLAIIRNALSLDCQSLKADFEALSTDKPLQHGSTMYCSALWDSVIAHLDEDNLPLSEAALQAIQPLPGLETFNVKEGRDISKEKVRFNETFEKISALVGRMLERMVDFKPEHLDELYKSQTINMTLVSALFFKEDSVRQNATDLIKSTSGQSGRKEAVTHLLQAFFATTLYGICWSLRRIRQMKTFGSVPYMMKTGMDILDILADSQSGILRTQNLNKRDVDAIGKYWDYQWQALMTSFAETENWHAQGHSKADMTDLCRDTMQFAEALFEQYDVFAAAISSEQPNESARIAKELLQSSASVMDAMVRWLRLKDEYLATTLVKLTTKMLHRLGRHSIQISSQAVQYIEATVGASSTKASVKTMLTPQQKAELVKALESYHGRPLSFPTLPIKKQTTLKGWTDSTGVATPSTLSERSSEDEFGDSDIADGDLRELSKSVELNKARIAAERKPPSARSKLPPPAPKPPRLPVKDVAAFRQKREQELEAKRKRDLEQIARKKGLLGHGVAALTAGQGSGVKGIGVTGKDHAPINSMMVSSESESDSEDELDRQIFGASLKANSGSVPGNNLLDGRKQQLKTGPVKKVKQVRSAKDMRARLAPDLSPLHKNVLSWDFFAESDFPPSSDKADYTLVSSSFRHPMDYQRTFEPLLILEAWQSFRAAREDNTFKPFQIKVANRMNVDNFVDVSTSIPPAEGKDLGLGSNDVVLLSKVRNGSSDASQPHCLARISGVGFKKGNMEITYRTVSGNPLVSSLAPGIELWGFRILSLTTMEREFGALKALQYYDLCDEIIRAKPSPILSYPERSLEPLIANYEVNVAQAKAVKSALENDAFTLIQGPPGSGKTKTIVALVGAMLSGSLGQQGIAVSRPPGVASSKLGGGAPTSRKLLVCAPSNAAVDELVMRFKKGVKTLSGKLEKVSIVRLGKSDSINSNVKDVTLEELVSAKLNTAVAKDSNQRDIHEIMMEHKDASERLIATRTRLDESKAKGQPVKAEDEKEFENWKRKKTVLGQQIDKARDSGNSAARDAELSRRRVQQDILDNAHIICATLSGSGHDIFQHLNIEFETVIIDEAAQSIELSALIPLKYGCSKCILVGDPKQLPPTVLSKEAAKFQYEQSLFVRMQGNHPNDVHLLDTQYRMHPEISLYPSQAFYDGKLQDGPGMAKLRYKPWHQSPLLGPYRFFDVQGMHQSAAKGHSLVNTAELEVALQLYERITTDCRGYDFRGKIGIITPYKGQLRELRRRFAGRYGDDVLSAVEFNTTDAFQGRESEIIIFSCVRASTRGIGFLADIRRMNVGLTRAKSSLWVLGNSQSLIQGQFWRGLVENAKSRSLYTDGDVLTILRRPQLTLDMNCADVEMSDADTTAASKQGVPGSADRPSPVERSTHALASGSERRIPQRADIVVSAASSLTSTPAQTPPMGPTRTGLEGPSGGKNGLNALATCNICGSFEHYTHMCDNIEAKVASVGRCARCRDETHTARYCTAPRCVDCGEFGHLAQVCTSLYPLSNVEKAGIAKEERSHVARQNKNVARDRQRQLGEHAATVPIIQATPKPIQGQRLPPANAPKGPKINPSSLPARPIGGGSNQHIGLDGKRKRPDSPPMNPPRGPKSVKSDSPRGHQPVEKVRAGAGQPLVDEEDLRGTDFPPGPIRNMQPMSGRPGGAKPPPGFIRKKREADSMFIKPKRRPNP